MEETRIENIKETATENAQIESKVEQYTRPTDSKFTEETVRRLEEAFMLDCSIEEAAYWAKISRQTLYTYFKKYPALRERLDALRQRPFLKARQTIVKSLDDPEYAFKYMERKRKSEFAQRTEFTGADGDALQIQVVSYKDTPIHIEATTGTETVTDNAQSTDTPQLPAEGLPTGIPQADQAVLDTGMAPQIGEVTDGIQQPAP